MYISRVWALFSIEHGVIVVTQIIKLIDEVQDSFGILPLMLERLSLIYYKAFRCGMARVRFRYGGLVRHGMRSGGEPLGSTMQRSPSVLLYSLIIAIVQSQPPITALTVQ